MHVRKIRYGAGVAIADHCRAGSIRCRPLHPMPLSLENDFQRKELTATATERAVVSDLFLSFGTVDDRGQVTLQPCDLQRMLQSMGVVSELKGSFEVEGIV